MITMQPASDRWTFPSPLKCRVLWHPSFQLPTAHQQPLHPPIGLSRRPRPSHRVIVRLPRCHACAADAVLGKRKETAHLMIKFKPIAARPALGQRAEVECRWPRGTRPHLLLRRFQFPARNLFTPRLPRPPRGRVVPRRAGGPHDLKCEGDVVRDGRRQPRRPDGRGWSHNRHFHCAAENICIPRRRSASPRVREMECLASSRTQKTNLSLSPPFALTLA